MTDLRDASERILKLQLQYSATNSEPMIDRRRVLMDEVVPELQQMVGEAPTDTELNVGASNGAGNSAKVPWARVFNKTQSPSPTRGWYVVLLFASDGSSVSLSLNQGVTQLSSAEIARNVETARRVMAAAGLSTDDRTGAVHSIELADPGLGKKYERGHVVGFSYPAGSVPDRSEIEADLLWLLERLRVLPAEEGDNTELIRPPQDDDEALAELAAATYLAPEKILELFEGLIDESPQIILSGPPGTGKTFVAQQLAAYLLNTPGQTRNNPYIEIVQFHPSYGYDEFVEGLRPAPVEGGLLEFRPVPGVIARMADEIAVDGLPRVLIIDEMNRANLPKVFGELMFLLEYRDQDIRLMHRDSFSLPKNLYIIGTMNTADRSTKSLDLALRRRFDFFEMAPDVEVLEAFYRESSNENTLGDSLFTGFEALNAELRTRVGDRHYQVGHSYLMKPTMNSQVLRRIWDQQLAPLIEEYFFDSPSVSEDFQLSRFWVAS